MSNHLEFHLEGLESRDLMAADVSFSGDQLKINGDNNGDVVHIQGTGSSGNVEVYVNGVLDGTFTGVKRIKANMRGGNDTINMGAVRVAGDVTINMGSGADQLDVDTNVTNFAGSIGVDGSSVFARNLNVNMGGNAGDWLDWDTANGDTAYVYGNVTIRGASDIDFNGNGGSHAGEAGDIYLNGTTKIFLKQHGDVGGNSAEVFLDDVNFGDNVLVRGSFSDDLFRITDSRFSGKTIFAMGGGNDELTMPGPGNANRFNDLVIFNGGFGSDTLVENGGNIFGNGHLELFFETIV